MYSKIRQYCDVLITEFGNIPSERKKLLERVAVYIAGKCRENKPVNLVYICTHNSRRSHFGQVWSKIAAFYFEINGVNTFSGGTEATAFNMNAINALRRVGFIVNSDKAADNPLYTINFSDDEAAIECFSKKFDHPANPKTEFAAIMTCSDAEENCPFIPGAELRIATTYNDPKAFDNTPQQDKMYDERCRQIALECFYVFSLLK